MKNTAKCANLYSVGDLRIEERNIESLLSDEVLVEVKACGICGSDLPRVYTKGTYRFPTVIGHEFSGRVVYDKENLLTGKKVAVFPLLPCFECDSCKNGNYATCKSYDYYGSRRDGGMTEYLPVKRWNLVEMDDGISYEEGAMCEPISVARHATKKLNIQKGDTLLISGAGPIGIIAAQWAVSFGAEKVYFFDIDGRKVEFAKQMGFEEYKGGERISCVIEGTGNEVALARCLEAIEPFGRMVLMGNPSGGVAVSQNTYWHILRKELVLFGTWNSSYNEIENDWRESLKALSEGRINVKPLITHKFPLEEVNTAFEMMKNRTEFFNKVMLVMNGEN